MGYEKYYQDGWKSGEAGGTPITPEALNHMEAGIKAAGDHADNTSNPHGVTAAQVGARPNTWTPTAADVGAVPTSRTVNGKALSGNITLSASDVGAVPTSRTVNNKALSSNITLAASDVGAVPTSRTVNGKALSANISLTADNVGAASITSLWTNSSPTAAFASQSISKTLSSYDALLILTRTHKDNSYTYGATETSLIVRVGGSGMIHDTSESGAYLVSRKVTVTTSKITFGNAEYAATYGKTGLTTSNNSLIPTYIYGIKW